MTEVISSKEQIALRREAIQVAAGAARPTYGVLDIIFDAVSIYDFCTKGELPELDQAAE